jgi:hypothetical protein
VIELAIEFMIDADLQHITTVVASCFLAVCQLVNFYDNRVS